MVWSDPEIRKISRAFVTVAEEVHFLYPENEWALARVKDDPAHKFFKRFGESMPKKDWNHPGTKQGVYMIGPNAEYLEGQGAISGDPKRVLRRLRTALERWRRLRKEKKYANKQVPIAHKLALPNIADKPLVLRVFLRDLPRDKRDRSGRRFTKSDTHGMWLDFTKWAWNENWLTFDDPRSWVPSGKKEQPVARDVVERLCREVLVDNVRGQAPRWLAEHVKKAELTMRRVGVSKGRWTIEYRGRAEMDSGTRKYAPLLYGRAIWNPRRGEFERLDLLAIGQRSGKGPFNQRERDPGPAPMGIVLELHRR